MYTRELILLGPRRLKVLDYIIANFYSSEAAAPVMISTNSPVMTA